MADHLSRPMFDARSHPGIRHEHPATKTSTRALVALVASMLKPDTMQVESLVAKITRGAHWATLAASPSQLRTCAGKRHRTIQAKGRQIEKCLNHFVCILQSATGTHQTFRTLTN